MVDNIPAECHYGAGAVGKDRETGVSSDSILRTQLKSYDMILKGQNFPNPDIRQHRLEVQVRGYGDQLYRHADEQHRCATKDDVGMAAKPTMTSQGWSVSVESLDVAMQLPC